MQLRKHGLDIIWQFLVSFVKWGGRPMVPNEGTLPLIKIPARIQVGPGLLHMRLRTSPLGAAVETSWESLSGAAETISKMRARYARRIHDAPGGWPKVAAQKKYAFRLHGTHNKNGLPVWKLENATLTGVPN